MQQVAIICNNVQTPECDAVYDVKRCYHVKSYLSVTFRIHNWTCKNTRHFFGASS